MVCVADVAVTSVAVTRVSVADVAVVDAAVGDGSLLLCAAVEVEEAWILIFMFLTFSFEMSTCLF